MSRFLTGKVKKNVKIIAYLLSEGKGEIGGIPIISFENLKDFEYEYIVVAFGNTVKGIEILRNIGIPVDKIIGYAYSGLSYDENVIQNECNKLVKDRIRNSLVPTIFDLPEKQYFLCGMNVAEETELIRRDFVREQTMVFLAKEINRRNIEGSVAEIGVSRGEFAWKINYLFPNRKIYLFDTFEGLPPIDKNKAIEIGWGEKQYAMEEKGTVPEDVLNRMPYKSMCVIKQGIFPDTFDVDENFAFVSLDIDFYATIRSGLERIYPKLSKGGYIMVHDFHNLSFIESRNAIIDFCEENDVPYVPIPDYGGSAVIVK